MRSLATVFLAALFVVCVQAVAVDPLDYKVEFDVTPVGKFVIQVHHAWAPLGAERFKELVSSGFYDGAPFFRTIPNFMVQFGINSAKPDATNHWAALKIKDDPVLEKNIRGRITYAMAGPNTRTSQVFINFGDNTRLDSEGFAPFGEVIDHASHGMRVVDKLYGGYGEGAPGGRGPAQGKLYGPDASKYLADKFPLMSYVKSARLIVQGVPPSLSLEPKHPAAVVKCQTTRGEFRIILHRSWAPLGAARFEQMLTDGYFEKIGFYRVIPGFLTQFGIAGANPQMQHKWDAKGTIMDDPPKVPHEAFPRGGISFAGSGRNSRTTQLFISFTKSISLGRSPWETPFGVVPEEDMKNVIDKLYSGYGDMAPFHKAGVNYGQYLQKGNKYLQKKFPSIDYIESCAIKSGQEQPGSKPVVEMAFHDEPEHKQKSVFRDPNDKNQEPVERKIPTAGWGFKEDSKAKKNKTVLTSKGGDVTFAAMVFAGMCSCIACLLYFRKGSRGLGGKQSLH